MCRTLQCRQAFLEGTHRRVGEAGIDIAFFLVGEARRGLAGAFEHETRSQKYGVVVLGFEGARLAAANREGVEFLHGPWSL